jgi:hypothetical protein
MLRVSYSDSAGGQRWSLCGRLAGPWVEELRSYFRQVREHAPRAPAVVDLNDVTFIDEAGEKLLGEMHSVGIEFVAAGVENKHLLANLKQKKEGPPRGRVGSLRAACSGPERPQGGDE